MDMRCRSSQSGSERFERPAPTAQYLRAPRSAGSIPVNDERPTPRISPQEAGVFDRGAVACTPIMRWS
jgi:hypothetical protein